jgi:hypothetical protein
MVRRGEKQEQKQLRKSVEGKAAASQVIAAKSAAITWGTRHFLNEKG